MPITHVSKQALGTLRPPARAEIQATIAAQQWSPAKQTAHAKNMQQLGQKASQFAQMSPTQRKAQSHGQNRVESAVKTAPRHNSVARTGYPQTQAKLAPQNRRDRSHLPKNVQTAIARNERRAERAMQRQARQARVATKVKDVGRAAGQWAKQQPRQAMQAIAGSVAKQQQQQRQYLTEKARQQNITRHAEPSKARGQNVQRSVLDNFARPGPSQSRGQQQQPRKEQQRGQERTR